MVTCAWRGGAGPFHHQLYSVVPPRRQGVGAVPCRRRSGVPGNVYASYLSFLAVLVQTFSYYYFTEQTNEDDSQAHIVQEKIVRTSLLVVGQQSDYVQDKLALCAVQFFFYQMDIAVLYEHTHAAGQPNLRKPCPACLAD